ncbi:MAG TPA: VOC family protein [Candidatus Elarobacter sp.]|jgi:PhnB protein
MQLQPYIFFYGRCDEALEFYKSAFGGSYEAQRVGGTPMAEHFPPGSENRVMHASFTAPGVSFFASDGREEKSVDPDAGNVSLALNAEEAAEGERVFAALCEGGDVRRPIEDAFWGGRFGMVVDRFGIEWMLTLP